MAGDLTHSLPSDPWLYISSLPHCGQASSLCSRLSHNFSLLTPHSLRLQMAPSPSSDPRLAGQSSGVLLSSSLDARTQAPCSHPLSPEVTEGHEWEKQVLEHGTFESTGGTEMGEGLSLPQLCHCLGGRPVTPNGLRSSPTLPGQSPSLGI